jgi:hypothetical protein
MDALKLSFHITVSTKRGYSTHELWDLEVIGRPIPAGLAPDLFIMDEINHQIERLQKVTPLPKDENEI